jgi:hypothetical protein
LDARVRPGARPAIGGDPSPTPGSWLALALWPSPLPGPAVDAQGQGPTLPPMLLSRPVPTFPLVVAFLSCLAVHLPVLPMPPRLLLPPLLDWLMQELLGPLQHFLNASTLSMQLHVYVIAIRERVSPTTTIFAMEVVIWRFKIL